MDIQETPLMERPPVLPEPSSPPTPIESEVHSDADSNSNSNSNSQPSSPVTTRQSADIQIALTALQAPETVNIIAEAVQSALRVIGETSSAKSSSSSVPDNDDNLIKLVTLVRQRLQKPVTAARVIVLVSAAVKAANEFTDMTDDHKKRLVQKAVKQVVKEHIKDDAELMDLVDVLTVPVADSLFYFANNTLLFMKDRIPIVKRIIQCCSAPAPPVEKLVDMPVELLDNIHIFINSNIQKPFKVESLIRLTSSCVKFMQKPSFKLVHGSAKKNVIIRLLRLSIEKSDNIEDADRPALLHLLDTVCSDFIDAAVMHGKN